MRIRRGSIIVTTAAAIAMAALSGCGAGAATTSSSPAWATVNGHAITKSDVVTRINIVSVLSPQAAAQLKLRSTYVSVTQELASEYLLTQEANAQKITATKQQISASQSQFRSYILSVYSGSTANMNKALAKAGVTTADLNAYAKEAVIFQNLFQKVVKPPTVTAAQIAAYYKANSSQFNLPEEYHLRHILVKTQALAEQILKQLQAGASFAALAKKYSTDPGSASKGGDLGFQPLTAYVAPFAAAAQKLTKVGQLSPIVHSQFGYHIIQLLGIHQAGPQSLSAVSSQIQSLLQQQGLQSAEQAYVNSLTAKAKIKLKVPKQVP